jgi:hypothetical protein
MGESSGVHAESSPKFAKSGEYLGESVGFEYDDLVTRMAVEAAEKNRGWALVELRRNALKTPSDSR